MKFSSAVAPLALVLATTAPSAYAGPLAYGICQTGEQPLLYACTRAC